MTGRIGIIYEEASWKGGLFNLSKLELHISIIFAG